MDGFRRFPLLFLLPLILGCFLSPSKAVPLSQESNEDIEYDDLVGSEYRGVQEEAFVPTDVPMVKSRYRKMDEVAFFPTGDPIVKSRYRKMDEMASFPTGDPIVKSRYRRMDELASFPTGDPIVKSRYRSTDEQASFVPEDPQSGYRKVQERVSLSTDVVPNIMFREFENRPSLVPRLAPTKPIFGPLQGEVGYRNTIRTFIKILKSLTDLFIAEIQDDDKWDALREVVVKIAETIKAGLEFIANLSVFD